MASLPLLHWELYICATQILHMLGPVLNSGLMIAFFAYIANSMIAHIDAAVYGVLLLDSLLYFN